MTNKTLYIVAFCALAVLVVTSWMVSGGRTIPADRFVQNRILQIYNPNFEYAMKIVSLVLNPAVLVTFSAISMILLFIRRKHKIALVLFIGVGGSSLLSYVLKDIFIRLRPVVSLTWTIGYSFPSGHATVSAAFFFLMIYFFKNRFTGAFARTIFIITNILLFALVGFSRLYLNVHWTSDVIAGFSLGLSWASFVILASRLIF
jgi:membrane-associated phospholipid phosphatase